MKTYCRRKIVISRLFYSLLSITSTKNFIAADFFKRDVYACVRISFMLFSRRDISILFVVFPSEVFHRQMSYVLHIFYLVAFDTACFTKRTGVKSVKGYSILSFVVLRLSDFRIQYFEQARFVLVPLASHISNNFMVLIENRCPAHVGFKSMEDNFAQSLI